MNTAPRPGDQARVTVTVAVAPAEAFRVFTEDIDRWWRRGPRFRNLRGERGMLCIEPRHDGRVFESLDDGDAGAAPTVVEIGRVLAWEPAQRLMFTWRASNFGPGESTEVEVLFEPAHAGDEKRGTRVTVTHRGFAALRPDHPVRHGRAVDAFIRSMGLWWGDLATALREYAAERAKPDAEPNAEPD